MINERVKNYLSNDSRSTNGRKKGEVTGVRYNTQKKKQISLNLTENTLRSVDKMARMNNLSRSGMVCVILDNFFEEEDRKNLETHYRSII